jgi:hypothetical protein
LHLNTGTHDTIAAGNPRTASNAVGRRSLKSSAWLADARRFEDPSRFMRESRNAHAQAFSGRDQSLIDSEVMAAWQRSTAAGLTPDLCQPEHVLAAGELHDRRLEHPLAAVAKDIVGALADESAAGRHLVILTDAAGQVLWRAGSPWALRRGDRVALAEGADWSESGFGTNAISQVVVMNEAVNMMSGEHYVRALHEWFCTASPLRDDQGRLLGVLDISIPTRFASNELRTLVKSGVHLAETLLNLRVEQVGAPASRNDFVSTAVAVSPPTAPGGGPHVGAAPGDTDTASDTAESHSGIGLIRLLSYKPEVVCCDGTRIPLTRRRAELLALLASREAWTAQALAHALYGESGSPTTVRGEVRRLKQSTGLDIDSNPYALSDEHRQVVDFLRPGAELERLLPDSEVEAIADLRWG